MPRKCKSLYEVGNDLIKICIGPNVWGKGKTTAEAVQKARKSNGGKTLSRYLIYVAHPGTHIDESGALGFPSDAPIPLLVQKVIKGKEVPLDYEETK